MNDDPATLRDRVVVVTGANGFIGRHLCAALVVDGARVHAASRNPSSRAGVVANHACDLSDASAVDRLFDAARPDVVFHLAARVTGSRDVAEVAETFAANLASTVHVLRNAHAWRCRRVVLAGSLEEGNPAAPPSSPYAASKAAASMYARMFHALYGTPVVTARLFMVYGPAQRDLRKLVPYVATTLLRGDVPRLTSGARPVDWVYVDDVVHALRRCATAAGIEGTTVDVGTGELTSVRGVAERIGRLVGGRGPIFGAVDERPAEQVRAADPAAAAAMIGRPMIGLDEGLRRTVAWYRAHADDHVVDTAALPQRLPLSRSDISVPSPGTPGEG